MNNQEAFDKVSKHLLDQGKPATRNGTCSYRGEDGTSCAVGCLIPDELYTPDMELKAAVSLLNYPRIRELFHDVDIGLLSNLQTVHDTRPFWKDLECIKLKLRSVACKYSLNIPEWILAGTADNV